MRQLCVQSRVNRLPSESESLPFPAIKKQNTSKQNCKIIKIIRLLWPLPEEISANKSICHLLEMSLTLFAVPAAPTGGRRMLYFSPACCSEALKRGHVPTMLLQALWLRALGSPIAWLLSAENIQLVQVDIKACCSFLQTSTFLSSFFAVHKHPRTDDN